MELERLCRVLGRRLPHGFPGIETKGNDVTSTAATVNTAQARELAQEPRTRVVDVRTPGEFEAVHIPGSHNVPLDLLRAQDGSLAPEHNDPVVLVCGTGARAEQARNVLETAGFGRLSVLRDGIAAWERDGAPLERGRGAWSMERQVRLAAGGLVVSGVLGSLVYRPLKWLSGFVGAGLVFAAVTDTCGMAKLLGLLPHNRKREQDASTLLAALTGPAS